MGLQAISPPGVNVIHASCLQLPLGQPILSCLGVPVVSYTHPRAPIPVPTMKSKTPTAPSNFCATLDNQNCSLLLYCAGEVQVPWGLRAPCLDQLWRRSLSGALPPPQLCLGVKIQDVFALGPPNISGIFIIFPRRGLAESTGNSHSPSTLFRTQGTSHFSSISHTKDLHRIQSLGKTDGGSFCFVLFVLWGPLKRNVYGFFLWKRGEIFEIQSLEENPEFFSLCCLLFLQGSDKIGMTEGPLSKRKYQENTYTLFLHVCIIYTLFIIYTLHNNYIAMYYIIDCI